MQAYHSSLKLLFPSIFSKWQMQNSGIISLLKCHFQQKMPFISKSKYNSYQKQFSIQKQQQCQRIGKYSSEINEIKQKVLKIVTQFYNNVNDYSYKHQCFNNRGQNQNNNPKCDLLNEKSRIKQQTSFQSNISISNHYYNSKNQEMSTYKTEKSQNAAQYEITKNGTNANTNTKQDNQDKDKKEEDLETLIRTITEQLNILNSTFQNIKGMYFSKQIEHEYERLHTLVHEEHFWKHEQQQLISAQFQKVKQLHTEYTNLNKSMTDMHDYLELFADDIQELNRLHVQISQTEKELIKFKIQLLLSGETDNRNCFVHIIAGAGGTESQDWVQMLLRMYTRFCERNSFKVEVVDYLKGDQAGIKSVTLFVKGAYSNGFLRQESGVHRLVRLSPFDTNKRRHTSFAAVTVSGEVETQDNVTVNPSEVRIDTYRSGGAGGQHVNTTDSAVRLTHLPTNIVVCCQSDRSQIKNRATAMKMLEVRLLQLQVEKDEAKDKLQHTQQKKNEWGSQIRSYVLHPYKMVKDHRSGYKVPTVDKVLDGDIMVFIEQMLITRNAHQEAHLNPDNKQKALLDQSNDTDTDTDSDII